MPIKHASPVTVSLKDLQSNTIPFTTLLSAFGPDSLGILVVTDLPSTFPSLRSRVLSNSSRLASLPTPTLNSLTNPSAKYLVGWSHGVETLRPGVVDTAKGSFYMNCAFYTDPTLQSADAAQNPGFEEYTAPNIWPAEADIPNFRTDAEALISLIIDTAVLVARACDTFAEKEVEGYSPGYLERVVKTSTTSKARLLHYFPTTDNIKQQTNGAAPTNGTNGTHPSRKKTEDVENEDEDNNNDDWCTTHIDHGCLTGLTSAQYLPEDDDNDNNKTTSSDLLTSEIPSPSPTAGLYIRSRNNTTYKVSIPRDALAFQTGEALELITGGRFRAVPHFVRGVDPKDVGGDADGNGEVRGGGDLKKVARNTLAVFTQPNLGEVVDLRTGQTFGEFARGVVGRGTKD